VTKTFGLNGHEGGVRVPVGSDADCINRIAAASLGRRPTGAGERKTAWVRLVARKVISGGGAAQDDQWFGGVYPMRFFWISVFCRFSVTHFLGSK